MLHRAGEAYVVLPVLAAVLLLAVWVVTFKVTAKEEREARTTAVRTTQRLIDAYEAQTLRALNEISQSFRLVDYAYSVDGPEHALERLHAKNMLLPDMLFTTSILDRQGRVVASSRPLDRPQPLDGSALKQFQAGADTLVAPPRHASNAAESTIDISHRIVGKDGALAGIMTLTIPIGYLVSDYDEARFGTAGLLAVVGTDGVVRAKRSGAAVTAGETIDYRQLAARAENVESPALLNTFSWDGVPRYTAVRKLYGFPLAVIVGLSEAESMATARSESRRHVLRALAVSIVIVLVAAALTWLTRRLAMLRERERQAQIQHAQQVEYLAYHDGLTALPNRSFFTRTLTQQLSAAHRSGRKMALLYLDLDGFKKINDLQGHQAGDELLKEVAIRLRACVRDADVAARMGGDEFVVLLPDLQDDAYVALVADRIVSAISKPFTLGGQESRVTASIGIALYPKDGTDEETLAKHADAAMYRAKERGKNNYQFYSAELSNSSLERLALEASLRNALKAGQFHLHYQPKRDTVTGAITGAEALLRWQHPDLGTVLPMKFIPVAEETGLIVSIGAWVLATACRDNMTWQSDHGGPALPVGVNLTLRQFMDRNLLRDVKRALHESGMPAHLLELEISEATLLNDVPKAVKVLEALQALGVRTAIDDFGAGYASLLALRQFPVDTVKINRACVREVARTEEDGNMTRAIIAMGKSLGLAVVAQGVENEGQMQQLREQACAEVQGFYCSRPLPAEQLLLLLQQKEAETVFSASR